MKSSLLATIFVASLPFSLFSAEPSAFSAGNLNNPNPYGLTPSEKALLENKKNLRKVVVKSNNQANEVDSIRERIDGLQTIIEILSRKSQENKIHLKKLDQEKSQELDTSNEYEKRLSEFSQVNRDEISKLKLVITELSSLISTINTMYISKKEFNVLVNDVNKFKDLVAKELSNNSAPVKSKLSSMSSGNIATKAKAFYDKKYYTKAIEYYSYLIDKNYKPAYAHYMIGAMNFKRKNYADAISYYKKSAALYSKASYMPDLMLNTAISMEKTKDKKNAKAFFNGVIVKYPDSSQAKSANKYLKSMK